MRIAILLLLWISLCIMMIYGFRNSGFPFRRVTRTFSSGTRKEGENAVSGHAYFVATPLGNLKDMTLRGVEILREADVICAEDTRHTINLLRHLKIPQKQLISHHEHNHAVSIPNIVRLAKSGKSIAVVTDAGTPGISDPGTELAAALAQAGVPLHPVPGCAAVAAALSICGFSSSPSTFFWFLPAKGAARAAALEQIAATKHTVVLYEAPHRIQRTLRDIAHHGAQAGPTAEPSKGSKARRQAKGATSAQSASEIGMGGMADRQAVCCRELTKVHEQISRGTVRQLLRALQEEDEGEGGTAGDNAQDEGDCKVECSGSELTVGDDDEVGAALGAVTSLVEDVVYGDNGPIKSRGEFTLVLGPVSGNSRSSRAAEGEVRLDSTLQQLRSDGVRRSEAVKLCADMLGLPKSAVYSRALQIEDW